MHDQDLQTHGTTIGCHEKLDTHVQGLQNPFAALQPRLFLFFVESSVRERLIRATHGFQVWKSWV